MKVSEVHGVFEQEQEGQMVSDLKLVMEHSERTKQTCEENSRSLASLSYRMTQLCEQQAVYGKSVKDFGTQLKLQTKNAMQMVEANGAFTGPSKRLSDCPVQLRTANEAARSSMAQLAEQSRQMGVMALGAAIEAGRMGDAGRRFVSAAEEIRTALHGYEASVREIMKQMDESDAQIVSLSENVQQLIALLRENSIAGAQFMKNCQKLEKMYDTVQADPVSEELLLIKTEADRVLEQVEDLIKVQTRSRMYLEDCLQAAKELGEGE